VFFYSSDGHEPAHVHVERDHKTAKLWLDYNAGVLLERNDGFSAVELRRIDQIVSEHRDQLLKAWHDYFD